MGGSDKAPTHSLLGPANQEALKQSFMAQLKEADFLRWGSTKRVTGLRKAEQVLYYFTLFIIIYFDTCSCANPILHCTGRNMGFLTRP